VGVTPLPPVWSLGYHQSRWGYGGHDDLLALDARFAEHGIPCSGLWLDLDYMDGYRIFRTSEEMFPHGVQATADALAANGRRIVPILDPGVKFEPGNPIYDEGHEKTLFCLNAEGREFVGLVWPGETVFPDFTLPEARNWWAEHVKEFAGEGFGASWLDMNDPSTGPVDPLDMRFDQGSDPHEAHHNQYALGMQMASREGLLRARPNERPFLLSRSGYTGSSRHSAIWTGDNLSSYFYLKLSIPTSLGMSLSGLPFNGPDVGGFGGDCTEELLLDWTKASFLFPFMRNHSMKGSHDQEPWAYGEKGMSAVRRYIRLRYKMMPYLYNLFVDQEESGDPILRPLLYEFSGEGLEAIDDQFLVGAFVLQAPIVEAKPRSRQVLLPGIEPWFDARVGDWVQPGVHDVKPSRIETPLYFRTGAIVPMQHGTPKTSEVELRDVVFHIFAPALWSGDSEIVYRADDGLTLGYQSGERSAMRIKVVGADGHLALSTEMVQSGYGAIRPTFVFHARHRSVVIDGQDRKLKPVRQTFAGGSFAAWCAD
jgi:alpha-glucosidase